MEKNQKNNVIVVRVAEIVRLLLKRLWIIILAGILLAAAGYGYGKLTTPTPMYSATTKLYVTGVEADVPSATNINLGQQVLSGYIEIIKSRPVLEQVIENLELNMTYSELRSCIGTYVPEGTCMIEISVAFPEPEWAKKTADELVKISAARAQEVMGCTEPIVYEEAYVPTEPYNSVGGGHYVQFLLLGGMAGVAVAGFVILAGYFVSGKITNPNKVTDRLHMKTLGIIPDTSAKNAPYEKGAYQAFLSNLMFQQPEAKSIGFIGATEKEKKYEFIRKVATYFAEAGKRVLLLDTNLTNPDWGAGEGADSRKPGLETYLAGKVSLEEIVTHKDGIDYIHCKGSGVNAVELLESDMFVRLIKQQREVYDYVLLDTAPMTYVPDALCVARHTDTTLLVLSGKFSNIRKSREIMDAMKERKIPVLGAVLKDMDIHKGGKFFLKEFGNYFGVYKD